MRCQCACPTQPYNGLVSKGLAQSPVRLGRCHVFCVAVVSRCVAKHAHAGKHCQVEAADCLAVDERITHLPRLPCCWAATDGVALGPEVPTLVVKVLAFAVEEMEVRPYSTSVVPIHRACISSASATLPASDDCPAGWCVFCAPALIAQRIKIQLEQ